VLRLLGLGQKKQQLLELFALLRCDVHLVTNQPVIEMPTMCLLTGTSNYLAFGVAVEILVIWIQGRSVTDDTELSDEKKERVRLMFWQRTRKLVAIRDVSRFIFKACPWATKGKFLCNEGGPGAPNLTKMERWPEKKIRESIEFANFKFELNHSYKFPAFLLEQLGLHQSSVSLIKSLALVVAARRDHYGIFKGSNIRKNGSEDSETLQQAMDGLSDILNIGDSKLCVLLDLWSGEPTKIFVGEDEDEDEEEEDAETRRRDRKKLLGKLLRTGSDKVGMAKINKFAQIWMRLSGLVKVAQKATGRMAEKIGINSSYVKVVKSLGWGSEPNKRLHHVGEYIGKVLLAPFNLGASISDDSTSERNTSAGGSTRTQRVDWMVHIVDPHHPEASASLSRLVYPDILKKAPTFSGEFISGVIATIRKPSLESTRGVVQSLLRLLFAVRHKGYLNNKSSVHTSVYTTFTKAEIRVFQSMIEIVLAKRFSQMFDDEKKEKKVGGVKKGGKKGEQKGGKKIPSAYVTWERTQVLCQAQDDDGDEEAEHDQAIDSLHPDERLGHMLFDWTGESDEERVKQMKKMGKLLMRTARSVAGGHYDTLAKSIRQLMTQPGDAFGLSKPDCDKIMCIAQHGPLKSIKRIARSIGLDPAVSLAVLDIVYPASMGKGLWHSVATVLGDLQVDKDVVAGVIGLIKHDSKSVIPMAQALQLDHSILAAVIGIISGNKELETVYLPVLSKRLGILDSGTAATLLRLIKGDTTDVERLSGRSNLSFQMERPEVCEAVIHIIASTTYSSKIEFALSILSQQLVSAYGVAGESQPVVEHANPTIGRNSSRAPVKLPQMNHQEEKGEENMKDEGESTARPAESTDAGRDPQLGRSLPPARRRLSTAEKVVEAEQKQVSKFTESISLLITAVLGDRFSLLALVDLFFDTHASFNWLKPDLKRRVTRNREDTEMRLSKEITKMFKLVQEYWNYTNRRTIVQADGLPMRPTGCITSEGEYCRKCAAEGCQPRKNRLEGSSETEFSVRLIEHDRMFDFLSDLIQAAALPEPSVGAATVSSNGLGEPPASILREAEKDAGFVFPVLEQYYTFTEREGRRIHLLEDIILLAKGDIRIGFLASLCKPQDQSLKYADLLATIPSVVQAAKSRQRRQSTANVLEQSPEYQDLEFESLAACASLANGRAYRGFKLYGKGLCQVLGIKRQFFGPRRLEPGDIVCNLMVVMSGYVPEAHETCNTVSSVAAAGAVTTSSEARMGVSMSEEWYKELLLGMFKSKTKSTNKKQLENAVGVHQLLKIKRADFKRVVMEGDTVAKHKGQLKCTSSPTMVSLQYCIYTMLKRVVNAAIDDKSLDLVVKLIGLSKGEVSVLEDLDDLFVGDSGRCLAGMTGTEGIDLEPLCDKIGIDQRGMLSAKQIVTVLGDRTKPVPSVLKQIMRKAAVNVVRKKVAVGPAAVLTTASETVPRSPARKAVKNRVQPGSKVPLGKKAYKSLNFLKSLRDNDRQLFGVDSSIFHEINKSTDRRQDRWTSMVDALMDFASGEPQRVRSVLNAHTNGQRMDKIHALCSMLEGLIGMANQDVNEAAKLLDVVVEPKISKALLSIIWGNNVDEQVTHLLDKHATTDPSKSSSKVNMTCSSTVESNTASEVTLTHAHAAIVPGMRMKFQSDGESSYNTVESVIGPTIKLREHLADYSPTSSPTYTGMTVTFVDSDVVLCSQVVSAMNGDANSLAQCVEGVQHFEQKYPSILAGLVAGFPVAEAKLLDDWEALVSKSCEFHDEGGDDGARERVQITSNLCQVLSHCFETQGLWEYERGRGTGYNLAVASDNVASIFPKVAPKHFFKAAAAMLWYLFTFDQETVRKLYLIEPPNPTNKPEGPRASDMGLSEIWLVLLRQHWKTLVALADPRAAVGRPGPIDGFEGMHLTNETLEALVSFCFEKTKHSVQCGGVELECDFVEVVSYCTKLNTDCIDDPLAEFAPCFKLKQSSSEQHSVNWAVLFQVLKLAMNANDITKDKQNLRSLLVTVSVGDKQVPVGVYELAIVSKMQLSDIPLQDIEIKEQLKQKGLLFFEWAGKFGEESSTGDGETDRVEQEKLWEGAVGNSPAGMKGQYETEASSSSAASAPFEGAKWPVLMWDPSPVSLDDGSTGSLLQAKSSFHTQPGPLPTATSAGQWFALTPSGSYVPVSTIVCLDEGGNAAGAASGSVRVGESPAMLMKHLLPELVCSMFRGTGVGASAHVQAVVPDPVVVSGARMTAADMKEAQVRQGAMFILTASELMRHQSDRYDSATEATAAFNESVDALIDAAIPTAAMAAHTAAEAGSSASGDVGAADGQAAKKMMQKAVRGIYGITNKKYDLVLDLGLQLGAFDSKKVRMLMHLVTSLSKLQNKKRAHTQQEGGSSGGGGGGDDRGGDKGGVGTEKKKTGMSMPSQADLFGVFDTDHSGSIDFLEFVDITKFMGLQLSEQRALTLFAQADRKGNSKIDADEFSQALKILRHEIIMGTIDTIGLSTSALMQLVVLSSFVLLLLMVFIFLGIEAFTTGTEFSAVINAMLPITAGGALSEASSTKEEDKSIDMEAVVQGELEAIKKDA
jgi:hypothetical protein